MTDVSTKIQIIVRLLGNQDLKQWFEKEFITGYVGGKDLPDYRVSQAVSMRLTTLADSTSGRILTWLRWWLRQLIRLLEILKLIA